MTITLAAIGGCNHISSSPTAPTSQPVATSTSTTVALQSAPPSISCPESLTATAPLTGPPLIEFVEPGTGDGEQPINVVCTPGTGEEFPIGRTNVECVATDARGRTAACSFAVTVTAAPRLRRERILAFGDSITVGEMVVPNTDNLILLPTPSAAYPAVLSQLVRARYGDRPVVFSAGLSGEKATFADRRLPYEIGKYSAEAVVLLEGDNDLLYADPAAGIQAAELGVSTLATEARNRGARVFICTLPPTKPGRRQIPLTTIQAANDRLRAVARGEGAYLIDVFSALLPDLNVNVGSDGLHLTETGYHRLAETVFAALRADLEIH
jgi:lysophospholipase L1-like esterase